MSEPAPAPPAPGKGRGPAASILAGSLVAALTIFVVVMVASLHRSPGLSGLLSGVFVGLFAALLTAAAGAWLAMAMAAAKATAPIDTADIGRIEMSLAPVLAELEATRVDVLRQVNARMIRRIPLCAGGGLLFWVLTQFGKDPDGVFDLLLYVGMGGLAGYVWAAHKLGERYRRLYKDRVLPLLAAQFGALSYRQAIVPDLAVLRDERIFEDFDRVVAEDEVFGTYRGLAVSIIELSLTKGSGDRRQMIFNGLLTQIDLPRRLSGTTAVIADDGLFGNLRDRLGARGRERVRIEDPRFEKAYEVYGTDQIAARALLTPAFMERFLALASLPGFAKPLALARDNRLLLAMPKGALGTLFQPPSYREPAASREALFKLHHDIRTVLDAADAVIGLDQAARAVAGDPGLGPTGSRPRTAGNESTDAPET